ncbi:MAG: GDP-mannose 4,6-dehydratase [Planctomycetaceae bacterium]|nr:GDP-mannose 4,6-dehydratase [Planctomycetaceae bacterium]
MERILITGITGQDGAYLARYLLTKGYEVHGIRRRSSIENTERLELLLGSDFQRIHLHYGDMTDLCSLFRIVRMVCPDKIYHLAAQSHVHVSFETPEYTGNADALGTLRMLEAIRLSGLEKKTRFYQASTSELFGNACPPQLETTPFAPCSPYAAAKLYAYWTTVNYREAYNMFACNGILFNHESPLRGETFVTRKITQGIARIEAGLQEKIMLGNLDAKRDWGHAEDYVEGMWMMLQQDKPNDYVLATGKSHSVREWVEVAFSVVDREIDWQGEGLSERGIDRKTGKTLVEIDPACFRPTDVDHLCGDASKANRQLGWQPKHTFEEIVREMVLHDRKKWSRR